MKLSKHSIERGEERTGLSVKSFEKLAEKALAEGIIRAQAKGHFKKYLDSLFFHSRSANNMRVFGEHVYLFTGSTLITVLHLPQQYKVLVKKIKSRH